MGEGFVQELALMIMAGGGSGIVAAYVTSKVLAVKFFYLERDVTRIDRKAEAAHVRLDAINAPQAHQITNA